jgi:hypothetical protein
MRSAARTPWHPISGEVSGLRRRSFWTQRSTPHNSGHRIMKSVFRLAARRLGLSAGAPLLGAAPVSEKRIGLTRPHLSRGHLRVM